MRSRSDESFFPLHIDKKNHIVLVNILIEGAINTRTLLMALDTGASVTTIPLETALAIGLDPSTPESKLEMITASGMDEVPVVRAPKIKFFGFELENVEVGCVNLPPESRRVAGLIGLNILSQFDLFLGFRSGKLRIGK